MQYALDPARSTLVVEARSSVGAIEWECRALSGHAGLHLDHGHVALDPPPTGRLDVELSQLTSGNTVYDGELLRRVEARRHPTASIELVGVTTVEPPHYALTGELTFHGATRPLHGMVDLRLRDDGSMLVQGQQAIDIRDFDVPAPSMLMLKIYPDVQVTLIAVLVAAE